MMLESLWIKDQVPTKLFLRSSTHTPKAYLCTCRSELLWGGKGEGASPLTGLLRLPVVSHHLIISELNSPQ